MLTHRVPGRAGTLLACGAVALALLAAGCGDEDDGGGGASSGGGEASTVKVGVINDLSGPTASTQVPFNDGAKAFFEDYNANLEDGQHPIEPTFTDDKFDPAQALAAYKKAGQSGQVVTIGPNSSAAQPAIAQQNMTVPLISGVSTTIFDNQYIWNLLPAFIDQAAIMANYAQDKVGGDLRVAALVYDVPSGIEFAKALKEETEALGGTYLEDVVIAPTEAAGDWRAQAQKLAELEPNFVGFLGSAADPQTFLPAMDNAGLSDVMVGGVTPASLYKENWTETPEGLASKYFTISSITPADVESEGSEAIRAAADGAGKPEYANNVYFVQGWVAGMVAAEAINNAGDDPTAETVNQALGELSSFETEGLNPTICFGPDDHYGTGAARPMFFDLEEQKFAVEGEFDDWAEFVKTPGGSC